MKVNLLIYYLVKKRVGGIIEYRWNEKIKS